MESLLRLMNFKAENVSDHGEGDKAFVFKFQFDYEEQIEVLVTAWNESEAVEEAAHHAAEKGWNWAFYEDKPHHFPEELFENPAYIYTESDFIDNPPREYLEEVDYEEAMVAIRFLKLTGKPLNEVMKGVSQ